MKLISTLPGLCPHFSKTKAVIKECAFSKVFALLFVAVLASYSLHAATYTSIASGIWTNSTTWQGGAIPPSTLPAGDVVNIHHVVTYNLPNDFEISGTVNVVNGT